MRNELLADFHMQKGNAKMRGVFWKLEYWEWLQIWEESGHLHERGNRKGQWVMGRNGDKGSYSVDNVKIIRVETNNSAAALLRFAAHPNAGKGKHGKVRRGLTK